MLGARMAKYAVVKYRSPVAAPRAKCAQRSLELVLLPPAPNPVATVTIMGTAVIKPSR
jgi:hypothetical protein